jgi:hypothetical protein
MFVTEEAFVVSQIHELSGLGLNNPLSPATMILEIMVKVKKLNLSLAPQYIAFQQLPNQSRLKSIASTKSALLSSGE